MEWGLTCKGGAHTYHHVSYHPRQLPERRRGLCLHLGWEFASTCPPAIRLSMEELMLSNCKRLLRVPRTARRSNQSILKEINPEYSLEGLMLKLKFQYFGHLMRKANSLEKTLMLGKTRGKRRTGQQRMRWLDGIPNSMDMSLSKVREAWHAKVHGAAKSQTPLSYRTTTTTRYYQSLIP